MIYSLHRFLRKANEIIGQLLIAQISLNQVRLRISCASSAYETFRARTLKDKEPDTLSWLEYCARSGLDLIDVGCNIGIYSLYYARLSPESIVLSCDLDVENISSLNKNILLNRVNNITPYIVACSSDSSLSSIYFQIYSSGAGAGGLNSPYSFTSGDIKLVNVCMSASLSDIAAHANLKRVALKIDTDGNEMDVLKGASALLSQRIIETLMVEVTESDNQSLEDVCDFLSKYNYFLVAKSTWSELLSDGPHRVYNAYFLPNGVDMKELWVDSSRFQECQ
jgi:FkbM family methyltransferase